MIPFEAINSAALAQLDGLLSEMFPAGRAQGHEFLVGDLRGTPGESLSINRRTGKWSDFASGEKGGDPISLFAAAYHQGDRIAAAKDLGKRLGVYLNGETPGRLAPEPPRPKPADQWIPSDPPDDAPAPDLSRYDAVYPYRNADGRITRYVVRINGTQGKRKIILPLTWGTFTDGETGEVTTGWHRKHPLPPRSLYGLDRLANLPGRVVILVEGEKAADAAQAMLPDHPCVTWTAGTGNVPANDWSPLAGRSVIIWPDNDEPGKKAAEQLREILAPIASKVQTLEVSDLPEGSDAADVTPDDPVAWIKDRLQAPPPANDEPPPPASEYEYSAPKPEESPRPASSEEPEEGITPLGHDRGTYFYLSRATGQVEAIAAAQHTRGMLTHLASETYYWQRTRFAGQKGIDWNAAADDLRVRCRAVGIFDPDRLRGRGAWFDEWRSVLHLGDRLIVDGKETGLVVPGSRYVYEHSSRLGSDIDASHEPLSSAEAKRLMDLCVAAPWEAPDHMGRLLAGWCVIAPVCGAMPWRPHIWISSEAGGGKSWLLDNIIKPTVGSIALEVQSKTTEAGIRQTLGCDARPVLFDEAETQNDRDRDRVQLVLDLARQASNEDGAAIIKGSASGRAMTYRIRSCFAFSSVNVGISQAADESRTVVLTLSPSRDPEKRMQAFDSLRKLHAEVIVPGFAHRLLARTLSLLPVIRQNAAIFADAIARSGQSRRTGDTYGVLLAGAWSLRSRAVATAEEAEQFVGSTSWVQDAVVKGDVDPEWKRALATLLQHRVRTTNSNGRNEEIPIGELIETCVGLASDDNSIRPSDAATALNRIGIKPAKHDGLEVLFIGNHSTACQEAFARTPWAVSWLPTLSRAPGAKRNAANIRLAGNQTKALAIPREAIIP